MVVDVDVVNVFFNVRSHDHLVRELTPEEFKLFEDDRPQAIRYFSAESQQPLTLAIMLDSSSSQTTVLNKQLAVGERFLQQVLTRQDEAMVLGFDSRLQVHQEFTHSLDNVIAALARGLQGTTGETELESPTIPKERSTALYDGIVAVSRLRMQPRIGHKAMVILTDGQDMGSGHTAKQAIEAAQRSDTICYVLLIGDKNEMASTDYKGIERMRELTNETGGRMVLVGNDAKKLEASFNTISDELRHFYSLAYTPDRKTKNGEYRRISLKSKHNYRLQARKGYFATPREKKPQLEAMR
jgi:VWFA-related protein